MKNKAFLGIFIVIALTVALPASAQTSFYYTGPSYVGASQTYQSGQYNTQYPSQYGAQYGNQYNNPHTACPQIYNTLYRGSYGSQVSQLQIFLANRYSDSRLSGGYFGSLTWQYVMRFQAENGIQTTGTVGYQTRTAIQHACAYQPAYNSINPNYSIQPVYPTQPQPQPQPIYPDCLYNGLGCPVDPGGPVYPQPQWCGITNSYPGNPIYCPAPQPQPVPNPPHPILCPSGFHANYGSDSICLPD